MEENKAQDSKNIWSIKDEVLEKNTQNKNVALDLPEEESVSNNVNGYIINEVGNIVAQFSFFVETEGKDRIDLKVSTDGFMAAIYNRPTNIILGYGHPLRFSGLVDPKQSSLLHLGPDAANGEQILISVENDEKLQEQGIVVMMRDVDVMTEILPEDVRVDFEQSLIDALEPIDELNEIETSYNHYMRHIYVILGENTSKDNIVIEEEEVYE